MSVHSIILLLLIVPSAILIVLHEAHRVKTRKSIVIVPDFPYMENLEKDLDEIRGARNRLSEAKGSLLGRVMSLTRAVKQKRGENKLGLTSSLTKAFLRVRESSEAATAEYLEAQKKLKNLVKESDSRQE